MTLRSVSDPRRAARAAANQERARTKEAEDLIRERELGFYAYSALKNATKTNLDLEKRVTASEARVVELERANEELSKKLQEMEARYQQSELLNREHKEEVQG